MSDLFVGNLSDTVGVGFSVWILDKIRVYLGGILFLMQVHILGGPEGPPAPQPPLPVPPPRQKG
jgi:hypothetical protein